MTEAILELEGTWEELAAHAPELKGKRLRLSVVPEKTDADLGQPAKSLEDELDEMAARIPEEEWRHVPADLTDQIDHYVYGTPKR